MNEGKFSVEAVAARILVVRGKRVLIDRDLAQLYGVATMRLNEQVKRNRNRFPDDFMFQMTQEEAINLKSQFAMSSWGGRRHLPYVFTEQGVAMLSSVLRSERAVQVNIAIMRAFVKLRELLLTHRELAEKLEALGRRVDKHDERINAIFEAIKQLLLAPAQPVTKSSAPVSKPQIGFKTD
ncbi:MAG TPA: ORF6N domain-containing protein [Candidatus Omnitrophota bacterium]|nr:ORF6N domain-containing protein [Candidatus Omnitrophota bacterium]HRZ14098.1 ORF6N domain-containing protein [Candidatus Omnitrophota bacterium]